MGQEVGQVTIGPLVTCNDLACRAPMISLLEADASLFKSLHLHLWGRPQNRLPMHPFCLRSTSIGRPASALRTLMPRPLQRCFWSSKICCRRTITEAPSKQLKSFAYANCFCTTSALLSRLSCSLFSRPLCPGPCSSSCGVEKSFFGAQDLCSLPGTRPHGC